MTKPVTKIMMGGGAKDVNNPEHSKLLTQVIEQNIRIHGSYYYPGQMEVWNKVFSQNKHIQPRVVIKASINSRGRGTLREQVELTLKAANIEQAEIVQVCGNPNIDQMRPGTPFRESMDALIKEGKVGQYYPEVYWQYTPNYIKALKEDMFPGYIFYFNVVLREVQQEFFELLREKKPPVLALRALGGGPHGPDYFYDHLIGSIGETTIHRLMEESGEPDPVKFRVRFLLSFPFVEGMIFGTGKSDRFFKLKEYVETLSPLPDEIIGQMIEFQNKIWETKGMGNGEGLHRPIGRMALKLLVKETRDLVKRTLIGKKRGYNW